MAALSARGRNVSLGEGLWEVSKGRGLVEVSCRRMCSSPTKLNQPSYNAAELDKHTSLNLRLNGLVHWHHPSSRAISGKRALFWPAVDQDPCHPTRSTAEKHRLSLVFVADSRHALADSSWALSGVQRILANAILLCILRGSNRVLYSANNQDPFRLSYPPACAACHLHRSRCKSFGMSALITSSLRSYR